MKQAGARALAAAGAAAGVDEREEESEPGRTSFVAETQLPTDAGNFRVRAYRHTVGGETREDLAILVGEVGGLEEVPVRVHDACFTGEVLGSLKCDCAQQLQLALTYIRDNGPGIVLYLQQEGRGIGLANKIAAYGMQEQGLDTVDANRALGLPDDSREYSAVRNILDDLDVRSIKLLTNNPRKIERMRALGVEITERVPCEIPSNGVGPLKQYLDTKEARMRHMLGEAHQDDRAESDAESDAADADDACADQATQSSSLVTSGTVVTPS